MAVNWAALLVASWVAPKVVKTADCWAATMVASWAVHWVAQTAVSTVESMAEQMVALKVAKSVAH